MFGFSIVKPPFSFTDVKAITILTGAISYKRPKSFGDSRIKIPTRS